MGRLGGAKGLSAQPADIASSVRWARICRLTQRDPGRAHQRGQSALTLSIAHEDRQPQASVERVVRSVKKREARAGDRLDRLNRKRQDLIGDDLIGFFAEALLQARLHATRSSVLIWTMLIPAPIALRRSSSSVPDPPWRVKGICTALLISAILPISSRFLVCP